MSNKMNAEKLKKHEAAVRTGGKGTVRRKKKVTRSAGGSDSNKLAATLKRNGVNQLPGCEEATLFKSDGKAIYFTNPKVQASVQANTYFISGKCEEKDENSLPQSGITSEMMAQWSALQGGSNAPADGDDDGPPPLASFDK